MHHLSGPFGSAAGRFSPSTQMREWLRTLSELQHRLRLEQPVQQDHRCMANSIRPLACDILASAERRIRDGHYEDAAARCYRVLELVGQIRLFAHGHNSACLNPDDPNVEAFQRKLSRGKSDALRPAQGKCLTASRQQVARFLKHLGDQLAQELLRLGEKMDIVKWRNHGLLFHGYTALGAEQRLWNSTKILEKLLVDDDDKAERHLTVARSIDFSRG